MLTLDVRRQLVVFDTSFDLEFVNGKFSYKLDNTYCLDGSLQEAARFKAYPDLEHREITTTNHRGAALGAELSKYRQRTISC